MLGWHAAGRDLHVHTCHPIYIFYRRNAQVYLGAGRPFPSSSVPSGTMMFEFHPPTRLRSWWGGIIYRPVADIVVLATRVRPSGGKLALIERVPDRLAKRSLEAGPSEATLIEWLMYGLSLMAIWLKAAIPQRSRVVEHR